VSATTTQLLSSGEFCKLRYDTIQVHLQTFISVPVAQKCQILNCDTLVANERYHCFNIAKNFVSFRLFYLQHLFNLFNA